MSLSLGREGPHRLPLSFNLVYNPLYQRVAKDRPVIKDLKETAAAKILMERKRKTGKTRHGSSKDSRSVHGTCALFQLAFLLSEAWLLLCVAISALEVSHQQTDTVL